MKKIFLYSAILSLTCISSCNHDSSTTTTVSIETQNTYDDQAIQKFLTDNYLDAQGNIKAFSSTDATDDNYTKLSDLNPIKIASSGVVYIVRNGAQPTSGKTIASTDIIRLMHKTVSYIATNTDNVSSFGSSLLIANTMGGSGVPEIDPFQYYTKASIRTASGKTREFYEIEGFREALQLFKSFETDDLTSYNLQGIIIVPSRSAYARDANVYDSSTYKFNDRSFIFNFQVYKTSDRPASDL